MFFVVLCARSVGRLRLGLQRDLNFTCALNYLSSHAGVLSCSCCHTWQLWVHLARVDSCAHQISCVMEKGYSGANQTHSFRWRGELTWADLVPLERQFTISQYGQQYIDGPICTDEEHFHFKVKYLHFRDGVVPFKILQNLNPVEFSGPVSPVESRMLTLSITISTALFFVWGFLSYRKPMAAVTDGQTLATT